MMVDDDDDDVVVVVCSNCSVDRELCHMSQGVKKKRQTHPQFGNSYIFFT